MIELVFKLYESKFRSFLDQESQIEVSMTEVLEETKKLNITFSTDTEGTTV